MDVDKHITDLHILLDDLKNRVTARNFSEETLDISRRLLMIMLEVCESDYEHGDLIESDEESVEDLLGINRQDLPVDLPVDLPAGSPIINTSDEMLKYLFLGWYMYNNAVD